MPPSTKTCLLAALACSLPQTILQCLCLLSQALPARLLSLSNCGPIQQSSNDSLFQPLHHYRIMSRLYSYFFGDRYRQEMEAKLQLLERRLEDAEIVGRYRDAKLVALLDRMECLEAEFTRQKTTLLQQKTTLEEQLVHARRTRSNSAVQPLQPINDTSQSKPAIASAEVFLVDSETAQPLIAVKFADCIAPARREHNAELSTILLDEPFFKNQMRAFMDAHGRTAPPDASLFRCDTMSRISDSDELGRSAKDMYQSNEKGQMAYCLWNDGSQQGKTSSIHGAPQLNGKQGVTPSLHIPLGTLKIGDPEKMG